MPSPSNPEQSPNNSDDMFRSLVFEPETYHYIDSALQELARAQEQYEQQVFRAQEVVWRDAVPDDCDVLDKIDLCIEGMERLLGSIVYSGEEARLEEQIALIAGVAKADVDRRANTYARLHDIPLTPHELPDIEEYVEDIRDEYVETGDMPRFISQCIEGYRADLAEYYERSNCMAALTRDRSRYCDEVAGSLCDLDANRTSVKHEGITLAAARYARSMRELLIGQLSYEDEQNEENADIIAWALIDDTQNRQEQLSRLSPQYFDGITLDDESEVRDELIQKRAEYDDWEACVTAVTDELKGDLVALCQGMHDAHAQLLKENSDVGTSDTETIGAYTEPFQVLESAESNFLQSVYLALESETWSQLNQEQRRYVKAFGELLRFYADSFDPADLPEAFAMVLSSRYIACAEKLHSLVRGDTSELRDVVDTETLEEEIVEDFKHIDSIEIVIEKHMAVYSRWLQHTVNEISQHATNHHMQRNTTHFEAVHNMYVQQGDVSVRDVCYFARDIIAAARMRPKSVEWTMKSGNLNYTIELAQVVPCETDKASYAMNVVNHHTQEVWKYRFAHKDDQELIGLFDGDDQSVSVVDSETLIDNIRGMLATNTYKVEPPVLSHEGNDMFRAMAARYVAEYALRSGLIDTDDILSVSPKSLEFENKAEGWARQLTEIRVGDVLLDHGKVASVADQYAPSHQHAVEAIRETVRDTHEAMQHFKQQIDREY